jgi:hypothetical protein
VLTGEYYFGDEDSQHLQVWLWDGESGALVYTDELVAYAPEEAEEYMPALISWVFSKAAVKAEPAAEAAVAEAEPAAAELTEAEPTEAEPVEEPPAEVAEADAGEKLGTYWLYLGIEGGAAFNLYDVRVSDTYDGSRGQGLGASGGITLGFMPLPFLGLWTGAVFVAESFQNIGIDPAGVHTSIDYRAMSLRVPMLIGFSFTADGFDFALKPGAYYNLPQGKLQTPDGEGEADYSGPSFGVSIEAELGHPLGAGSLYGGLRYSRDLGATTARDIGLQYVRQETALFLGYRFGIGERNK